MKEAAVKKEITLSEVLLKYRVATNICFSMLLGFILSTGSIYEEFFPFLPAVVGAISIKYSFFSLLGGTIGCVFVFNEAFLFKYAGIAAIVFCAKLLYYIVYKKESYKACFFITLCSFLTVNLIIAYANGSYPLIYVFSVSEGILCSSLALFFFSAFSSLKLISSREKVFLSAKEKAALLISVCALLISLCSISISGLSVGVVLSAVLVLSSVYLFETKTFLIISVSVFCALTLNSPDAINVYAMIPVGVLVALGFDKKNRLITSCVFSAVIGIGAISSGYNLLTVPTLLDIIVGTVIYSVIPLERINRSKTDEQLHKSIDISVKSLVESKLDCASSCLNQIADAMDELSSHKDKAANLSNAEILNSVCEGVCVKCPRKLYCWTDRYNDTTEVFHKVINSVRSGETACQSVFPPYFTDKCINKAPIIGHIQETIKLQAQKKLNSNRLSVAKEAITESYRSLSYLLSELSSEISSIESVDKDGCDILSSVLKSHNIKATHSSCETLESGKTKFRFETGEAAPKIVESIRLDLEKVFETKLSSAHVVSKNNKKQICFTEAENYIVESVIIQKCNKKEKVCGDSASSFSSVGGNYYVVVCDGMGSGKNAAIDSAMCVGALEELLKTDLPIKSALKLVNSMLISKSDEESSCAIDILKVDAYTGETHIYKSGGVCSLIKQGGRVYKITNETMPVGILSEVRCAENKIKLGKGDIVVTMSDGASELSLEWLEGIIAADRYGDAKSISEKINEALTRALHAFSDDITIGVTTVN